MCDDLSQEAEIKLRKYVGLNDDNPSVIHMNVMPQNAQVVLAIQSQNRQVGTPNAKNNTARLNWKANLTHLLSGD